MLGGRGHQGKKRWLPLLCSHSFDVCRTFIFGRIRLTSFLFVTGRTETSIGQVEEEYWRSHCCRWAGAREERLSAPSHLPAGHCQATLARWVSIHLANWIPVSFHLLIVQFYTCVQALSPSIRFFSKLASVSGHKTFFLSISPAPWSSPMIRVDEGKKKHAPVPLQGINGERNLKGERIMSSQSISPCR